LFACPTVLILSAVGIGHVAGKDNESKNNSNKQQRNAAGRHKSGFSQPGPQMFLKGFAVGAEKERERERERERVREIAESATEKQK